MRLLTGCPVEWFGLHGPLHGLHTRHSLRHAAWHDQGFACSRPTLCLDCGMLKFVFACNICIVSALVYLYDINGCVLTCRIQASAARNLRAHTGLMTRGSGETSLSKTLMEKYLLGRQDFLPLEFQPTNLGITVPLYLNLSSGCRQKGKTKQQPCG